MMKNGGMMGFLKALGLGGFLFFQGGNPLLATPVDSLPASDHILAPDEATRWVDSVYACMALDERIGQVFMIRAHSNKTPEYEKEVANLIQTYFVGGLCFFQGTARHQAELTNYYQSISNYPLLISMDAEWGLGMRLKGPEILDFPRQIALGALTNNDLIFKMGKEVARQLRRIGTHVNFAPVVDINNNPINPVINTRSFGEDRENVSIKSMAYMTGLQEGHVMACAKHFPGHGDTDTDSHLDLPIINHSRGRLDSMELYPFVRLVQNGLQSVMVAHLHIPALDTAALKPTTLSRNTVTGLLRDEMGFKGLIFTDAMEMKGVTNYASGGQAELEALLAGNDIILLPNELPLAIDKIRAAILDSIYPERDFEATVKRILHAKYKLGLTNMAPVQLNNLEEDLQLPSALRLNAQLVEQSITLVQNKENLLPIKEPEHITIACLNIGDTLNNPFQQTLSKYAGITLFHANKLFTELNKAIWLSQLIQSEVVVVGLFGLSTQARLDFGITTSTRSLLDALAAQTKVVLVHFGNPYGLRFFENYDWVVQANQENPETQFRVAEGIMGHFVLQGHLPVTASPDAKSGDGHIGDNLFRLGYGTPEHVGMSSDTLARIDGIIDELLREKAAPGGQIVVVKNRKVVYQKAFGTLTYDSDSPSVTSTTLFDLASVTKAAGTTLAMMKLEEEGEIHLMQSLGYYLESVRFTDKEHLVLRDILSHTSGLQAWIPFYEKTLKKHKPSTRYYKTKKLFGFQIPVAGKLWLRDNMPQTMLKKINDSKLGERGKYVYSDLGFILLKEMIEEKTNKSLDNYLQDNFYHSLGLRTLGFNPLNHFPLERIAPSEEDNYFRMQRVQGYVHDMAAAMFGGVSGHAGLFSDAHDLAILFQMLLNDGFYGGKRYLKPETIRKFTTRCPDCTRRGLGMDMKDTHGPNNHISNLASDRTFGHLGFTGTCVWADPEHDLIFIFLSNRTYPSMDMNKLQEGQYRQRIQTIVYKSIQPGPSS